MKLQTLLFSVVGLLMVGILLPGCGSKSDSSNASLQAEAQSPAQHGEETEQLNREVHLTSQQINSLGIKVETIQGGSASSNISRPASVVFNLDRIAKVGPRIEAKVVKVLRDLGDQVNKDEPLALMSSVQLGKVKADYIRLRARLKAEKARYEREQLLFDQEISSEAEMLEAEANYQQALAEMNATAEALRLYGLSQNDIQNIEAGSARPLSYFYVTSPLDGRIQQRSLSPGQTVGPEETPIHVVDFSQLWVMIDAYEQDIPYLEKGQNVSLSVRSINGQTFEATTDWVSYALEEGTRTMPVRAVVDNKNGQLRSGMFGTARILINQERNIAMVPVDAVQTIENEKMVFIPGDEAGSFKPVSVMLGKENEGYVEIISGLQPRDRAVVAGAFDLKSALTSKARSADH